VTETSLTHSDRHSHTWWIIGLTLLALLLAGIAYALRGPVAAGTGDGTAPAGILRQPAGEPEKELPRSLRQYAAAPPAAGLRAS
jgi:hypothetical protein